MLTEAWYPLRYHSVQAALWNYTGRFAAVPAGRGSGKTEISHRHIVRCLPRKRGGRYFYGAPTEAQAKRIAWNHFLELIPGAKEALAGSRLPPDSWVEKGGVKLGDLRIETIFDSELHVVGMDRPARIEGSQWDGCVLDESCDLKPGVFDLNVLPALSWKRGWCWRIGVPKRTGPGAAEYREWYEAAVEGDIPDRAGFTWKSGEVVPREAVEYARMTMDPMDFAEQFDASFQNAGGGVYYCFDREENVGRVNYDPSAPIIVGQDFNVDPMCWVIGHYSREPARIWWFDEVHLRNTNTPIAADHFYGRYREHKGGVVMFPDAASRQRKTSAYFSDLRILKNHEGLKRLDTRVIARESNPPVVDRFAAVNAMLCNAKQERRMIFDALGCARTIKSLQSAYYKPDTRDPEGDLHAADAVGYAVHTLFPIRLNVQEAVGEVSCLN